MENLEIYKNISTTEDVEGSILSIINDRTLIPKVKKQLALLDPICEVINICQRKGASLADGVEVYIKMRFPGNCLLSQKNALRDRRNMALTDVALAAFYLDPFKNRGLLTREQLGIAKSFIISRLSENIRDQLVQYDTNFEEHFSEVKNITDNALDFWTLAECQCEELANIAMKLSQIPASTGQLERAFSMWQHIHSKVRNRLTFERSKTLMECYYYFSTFKEMKTNVLDYI